MLAYRVNKKIKTRKISLKLPDSFVGRDVDVIVIDNSDDIINEPANNENVKELLLSGPVWTKEDILFFEESTKDLKKWATI